MAAFPGRLRVPPASSYLCSAISGLALLCSAPAASHNISALLSISHCSALLLFCSTFHTTSALLWFPSPFITISSALFTLPLPCSAHSKTLPYTPPPLALFSVMLFLFKFSTAVLSFPPFSSLSSQCKLNLCLFLLINISHTQSQMLIRLSNPVHSWAVGVSHLSYECLPTMVYS